MFMIYTGGVVICTLILSMYKSFTQIAFMGQVFGSVPVAQTGLVAREVYMGRMYGIVSFLAVNQCQL